MPGTRYPSAEGHPPPPPPSKGECGSEALEEKRAQGSPLRGISSGSLMSIRSLKLSNAASHGGISYTSLSLIALMIASDLELTASLL